MKKTKQFLLAAGLLLSFTVQGETLYVTDRILLGVHQLPSEISPVLVTIPSGTPVTVLERSDEFIRVKLADGTEGWVSGAYLKTEKPATAAVDALNAKIRQEQETNKKLSEELNKLEREIQVRRDELSNARTTIKELQDAMKEQGSAPAPSEAVAPSEESVAQIQALQEQIARLEAEKQTLAEQSNSESVVALEDLQSQNQALQVRIEAALANLKGETVPTPAELAAIRPRFPVWYWLLLIALLVAGFVGGFIWYDYMHRKKHGGFRI